MFITAKTATWRYLQYRSDFLTRSGSDRQSWFAFSNLPLNTRDEFAILNALLNVQDERWSRPNLPTSFPYIGFEPHWAVRLKQEPWFILNGFHPRAESSPVFAF